ncbi:Biotin-requiring enzyme [Thiocystis violascens DSM 198]|uniref:Biotin-requiring enzyme n=2 Tax=Thiocystis violascens TaxID=73141 RepID=I3Y6M4_THIV6|nr:Biotin-requiring enzyme [Thiocystis violascens DSM 198]
MYGLEDSEEKNIKLCVEVGDRIYANDVIAKEKYSYSGGKSIRSNATGIVREILIDEESKVSNGTILLRVETFSSHSTASFVQEEISKFYQKIKSFF